MLTKEHLKFRVRQGRIKPAFVPVDDALARTLATDMTALLEGAQGMQVGELDEAFAALGGEPVGPAFRKLLLDGCGAEADDGKVEAQRWRAFAAGQTLRSAKPGLTLAAYGDELAAALGQDAAAIKDGLYADLPACRRIATVPSTTPEALIHRYNLAQVQGLLLRSRAVTITLRGNDVAERRALFRQLRFNRLMGEVASSKGSLSVTLSGPLGIFDQAASYGMRLAMFFPHILHLADWQLEAEVHINKKELTLRLGPDAGLVSHYRHQKPHIPVELLACIDAFNARTSEWQAAPGGDFVHIGKESYCFPDLTITRHDGQTAHVELFHRWHAKQLAHRLQALESSSVSDLFLGVSRNLARTGDGAALQSSDWFAKHGFLFADFPTPKPLLALLATYGKV